MLRSQNAGAVTLTTPGFNSPTYTSTGFATATGTNVTSNFALGETGIPLTITGVTANNKTYDGTTSATL